MDIEPYDNQKRFMEEMILRFEKAFDKVARSLEAHMRHNTAALEALTHQIEEHRIEFKEESRAHRQALLALIDRFEGNSGPSAGA